MGYKDTYIARQKYQSSRRRRNRKSWLAVPVILACLILAVVVLDNVNPELFSEVKSFLIGIDSEEDSASKEFSVDSEQEPDSDSNELSSAVGNGASGSSDTASSTSGEGQALGSGDEINNLSGVSGTGGQNAGSDSDAGAITADSSGQGATVGSGSNTGQDAAAGNAGNTGLGAVAGNSGGSNAKSSATTYADTTQGTTSGSTSNGTDDVLIINQTENADSLFTFDDVSDTESQSTEIIDRTAISNDSDTLAGESNTQDLTLFEAIKNWFKNLLSNFGLTGCSSTVWERPENGHIFYSYATAINPQLTITCPDDKDFYVKLKDETGENILAFYVRAGQTVQACVPAKKCYLYYALGNGDDWSGEENLFGQDGAYRTDPDLLNFANPLHNYVYKFNVSYGNFIPVEIDEIAFR